MRYGIVFLNKDYDHLVDALLGDESGENAAYLFGRVSTGAGRTHILIREVVPVRGDEIRERGLDHIAITSRSYVDALQYADASDQCFIFAHSHPGARDAVDFSAVDDLEESALFTTAFNRNGVSIGRSLHGSIVMGGPDHILGRVWLPGDVTARVEKVSIIGRRFRYLFPPNASTEPIAPFFDRQVRAFGPDVQWLLQQLQVGLVGVGGTGSAALEELVRLGIGNVTVIDPQLLEESNVNRVYGSGRWDDGVAKVAIAGRLVNDIGLGTKVTLVRDTIAFEDAARTLLDCDIVFGCSDDHLGRLILSRFALTQYVPVFDVSVSIDSGRGVLRGVTGRVTTLLPDEACLVCRERISVDRAAAEAMALVNPKQLERLQREGYAAELAGNAPAVIPYTTTVSALAVSELLHRVTGFMGQDRNSSELLILFDEPTIRPNRRKGRSTCFCQRGETYGSGDTPMFLGMTWPARESVSG
jgi:molybdopterin/thiamine biosynthesis adenylyltransferase